MTAAADGLIDIVGRLLSPATRAGAELPGAPGASGTVDLAVTGTSAGDVHVGLTFQDGRLVSASPEAPADPSLTLSLTREEAQAVLDGTLAPSVVYMRGRLRTSGDNRLLLVVLSATATPVFERWRSEVAGAAPPPA